MLDNEIRDFVFVPLIIMILLVGMLRYYSRDLMGSGPQNPAANKPTTMNQITKGALQSNEPLDFTAIQEGVPQDHKLT